MQEHHRRLHASTCFWNKFGRRGPRRPGMSVGDGHMISSDRALLAASIANLIEAPARARSGLSMSESRSGHGGSTVSSERNGPGHWQVLLDGDANDQALRPPVPA